MEALADPTRRRVVELLEHGELTAGQIAEQFTSSRPAVSRHLRLLREAGLVSVREDGTRRLYQLLRQPLADLEDWLAQRLDALDTEVRRGHRAADHHALEHPAPDDPAPDRTAPDKTASDTTGERS